MEANQFYLHESSAISSLQTETKKEEFRKYLESAGVLDALTKGGQTPPPSPLTVPAYLYSLPSVLVGLYEEPEKPNDPLVYLYTHYSYFACKNPLIYAAVHICYLHTLVNK